MSRAPPPPGQISFLVEVLGLDDTLRLIEAYGGTALWVPKGVGNSSAALRDKLEQQFGKPTARELIRGFGGGVIKVPLCPAWRTALYQHRGLSQAEIALKLGCHADTVSRRLKRQAENVKQMKMAL